MKNFISSMDILLIYILYIPEDTTVELVVDDIVEIIMGVSGILVVTEIME